MSGTSDRVLASQFLKDLNHLCRAEFDGLPGWVFRGFVAYVDIPRENDSGAGYVNTPVPKPTA